MNYRTLLFAIALNCSQCTIAPSYAEEQSPSPPNANADQDFCRSFADRAAEAKLLRHKQELLDLKMKIEEQLLVLDEQTKQLEALTAKRDTYRAAVSASLVKIYSNVEPDIAAQQLEKLSVEMASEVLQRLNPKISGEIVTAMDVKLASKVVKLMLADASKTKEKAEKP